MHPQCNSNFMNKIGGRSNTAHPPTTQYLLSQQHDPHPQPLSSQTNTQPFSQAGQMFELC